MDVADVIQAAGRWTVVNSADVVPVSWNQDAMRVGRALVAEGEDGADRPVLHLAFADRRRKRDWLKEYVWSSDSDPAVIGAGAFRHPIVVPQGGAWRVAGELVLDGRKAVMAGHDHRYRMVLGGAEVGEVGRDGGSFYLRTGGAPSFVARARAGEQPDPREVRTARRSRPEGGVRGWLAAVRDSYTAPAPPEGVWLEQPADGNGTWDVFDDAGCHVATLRPPGAAHTTRWAVLPERPAPAPEAVLLATYVVFSLTLG